MEGLFALETMALESNAKSPRLSRYSRLKSGLDARRDPFKVLVEVDPDTEGASDDALKFVDLFSGAGGMTLGFKQAGYQPVASVEINRFAAETHRRNFPTCSHFEGDIHSFDPRPSLGEEVIHLVIGGPPCQGFSVAGKRDPNDVRNNLFREFVRVVSEVRPRYVVMENVPGILTMKKGQVARDIKEAFAKIGYPDMSVSILESAAFGVPQIRPRAIFIANRLGLPNPFPSPLLEQSGYLPIEGALDGLPAYSPIPAINHEWTRHSEETAARIAAVAPGESLYESFYDAFKRQYPGVPSMTVKENHGGTHIHPYLNRVISAREMARLQTFPDDFIFYGPMKKAMWQIGNAIPPRLAKCIGLALSPYLKIPDDAETLVGQRLSQMGQVSFAAR